MSKKQKQSLGQHLKEDIRNLSSSLQTLLGRFLTSSSPITTQEQSSSSLYKKVMSRPSETWHFTSEDQLFPRNQVLSSTTYHLNNLLQQRKFSLMELDHSSPAQMEKMLKLVKELKVLEKMLIKRKTIRN